MIHDFRAKSSKSERKKIVNDFLTMLNTVLQFRFKAVMTKHFSSEMN